MKFTFAPDSRPLSGYTLKRAIHRGGFGEVYYALSDSGREVALKLLQHNSDVELRGVQQCLNLSHPNLVTIFDVRKDDDGDHWVVMEYVAGETLEAVLRRYPQGMPMEAVRKWLPGIAAGIGFLHRCGLVHRDLKPANIFIDHDHVKIGDVGLSKYIAPSRQSAHTQSVGTVYYMAPEVAKGRYGRTVDIYALGVILYEMLTGELPFDGESTGEILMKHLTEKPNLSRLPPRLQPVIAKALQKSPHDRYTSAEQLLSAFEEAVTGKVSAQDTLPQAEFASKKRHCGSSHQHREYSCRTPWDRRPWSGCGTRNHKHFSEQDNLSNQDKGSVQKADRTCRPHAPWVWLVIALACIACSLAPRFPVHPVAVIFALEAGVLLSIFALVRWFSLRSLAPANLKATPAILPTQPAANVSAKKKRLSRLPLSVACTSSLAAVPLTILLSSLLAAFRPTMFMTNGAGQISPALFGFFVAVSVLACWAMLFAAALPGVTPKGHPGRWKFALAGGLVGLTAWKLADYLFIALPDGGGWQRHAIFHQIGDHSLFLNGQGPTLVGFFAFFGFLFLIGRWDRLISPLRSARFRAGTVLVAVLLAWLTIKVFEFPPAWAIAWTAVIACSLQLSSPWKSGPHARYIDHSRKDEYVIG